MEKKKVIIGVISDTHLMGLTDELIKIADNYFSDVDLILHAGDLVDLSILDVFQGKSVRAVHGNMDNQRVREMLPEKMLFEINEFKFGLIHGWGAPGGIEKKIAARLGKVDCIVYGHTHNPSNRIIDDVLYFNPGSAVDKRFAPSRTIGILEIDDKITGRIISL